ncbi:MAG: thiamine-phosphate kinase [Burkholderiales bacterium]
MATEFELIAKYFTRRSRTAFLGIGDDCALVKPPDGLALAISTDMLVEGVHFFADVDPRALGHKVLAVNLSDLAAMGADPKWATLAMALPDANEAWIAAFAEGFFALADRFDVELIGGDTTRGPRNLCVTIMGTFPPGNAMRRDGAQVGDEVWISGETGAAALGVALKRGEIELDTMSRAACLRRLEWPEPRIGLGRALRSFVSAAIDISDGLVADLGHICERSNVGMRIDLERIPRAGPVRALSDRARANQAVLSGGDDYELAFTAPPAVQDAVKTAAVRAGVMVTCIGEVVATPQTVRLHDVNGVELTLPVKGFDHFG